MQSYKRKITYFFQYHNGTVGSTAGFLKLEIRGDKVKVNVNIQEPADLPYKEATLYFYHEAGDHLAALPVDRIDSTNGILTYQKRTSWQRMYDTDRDLYTFDGVAVVYNDSHYYIGDFKDKNRRDYPLVLKEPVKKGMPSAEYGDKSPRSGGGKPERKRPAKTEKNEPDGKKVPPEPDNLQAQEWKEQKDRQREWEDGGAPGDKSWQKPEAMQEEAGQTEGQWPMEHAERDGKREAEKEANREMRGQEEEIYQCEHCPYMKIREEQMEQEDAFEKMLRDYPKLPMYGVTELFDCVRIHPRDIGKLDMRNWKLGVNSFLTHGFYTYQYLLLGKMRFGNGADKPIIGVPGVYSNREKYLANMFGFDQFVPVKRTGMKTGEFGYWIVEISPYL